MAYNREAEENFAKKYFTNMAKVLDVLSLSYHFSMLSGKNVSVDKKRFMDKLIGKPVKA